MNLGYSFDDVKEIIGSTIVGVTIDQPVNRSSTLWIKLDDGRELKFDLPMSQFIYTPKRYVAGVEITNVS